MSEYFTCPLDHLCKHTPILPLWEVSCLARSNTQQHPSRTHAELDDPAFNKQLLVNYF